MPWMEVDQAESTWDAVVIETGAGNDDIAIVADHDRAMAVARGEAQRWSTLLDRLAK